MSQIEESLKELGKDIEFVKYHFTDMQGNVREVTITRDDVRGEGYTTVDGSSVFGKIIPPTESNMLLVPDSRTFKVLPWSKDTARVICDVYHPPKKEGEDIQPFAGCSRGILKNLEQNLDKFLEKPIKERFGDKDIKKIHAHFAPELEFILLGGDYDHTNLHNDQDLKNDNYFIPPSDIADKVLKDITKSLSVVGLKREKYHTEVTNYQYEIGIGHGNVLKMADATMTAKYLVEKISQKNGLKASFIPKFRQGVNGNGMHVHQNLAVTLDKEYNLFFDNSQENGLSKIGSQYLAGLLKYAREITAITNPTPVSYKRLVPGAEAPTYVAWDWQNRTALCRGHSENTNKLRVEYRSPDPTCNPYLAYSAMLSAGLSGISEELKVPSADKRDFYHDNKGVKELPSNFGEAIVDLEGSEMLKKMMGNFIVDSLTQLSHDVWKDYSQKVSDIDIMMYF